MDNCFNITDEAIDIAQDYTIVRAKLNEVRKKIDLIRKKIDSHDLVFDYQYRSLNNTNEYYRLLSYLIEMSEKGLTEIMYFGREIAYNAERIDKAMNMEDEQ